MMISLTGIGSTPHPNGGYTFEKGMDGSSAKERDRFLEVDTNNGIADTFCLSSVDSPYVHCHQTS